MHERNRRTVNTNASANFYLCESQTVLIVDADGLLLMCRPFVQFPNPPVADGLLPLHSTHLPAEAHPQHGHQGGPTRGCPRENLPAWATQLGPRKFTA